jgi:hypothetical protein
MREEQGAGPNFDQQRTITVETSRRQTPGSWWIDRFPVALDYGELLN